MKNKTFRNAFMVLAVGLLSAASACIDTNPTLTHSQTSAPPTTPASLPPTTPPPITGTTGIPGVQIVAIALDRTIIQNPGGPTVIMELKNIATEAIVSLDVKVYEPSFGKSWTFNFGVSQASPLVPGVTIGLKQTLIGPSGWGTGIPYFVTIAGTYSSGTTFSFRWTPPGDGDFNTVTLPP